MQGEPMDVDNSVSQTNSAKKYLMNNNNLERGNDCDDELNKPMDTSEPARKPRRRKKLTKAKKAKLAKRAAKKKPSRKRKPLKKPSKSKKRAAKFSCANCQLQLQKQTECQEPLASGDTAREAAQVFNEEPQYVKTTPSSQNMELMDIPQETNNNSNPLMDCR